MTLVVLTAHTPDTHSVAAVYHVNELFLVARARDQLVRDGLVTLPPGVRVVGRDDSVLVGRRDLPMETHYHP